MVALLPHSVNHIVCLCGCDTLYLLSCLSNSRQIRTPYQWRLYQTLPTRLQINESFITDKVLNINWLKTNIARLTNQFTKKHYSRAWRKASSLGIAPETFNEYRNGYKIASTSLEVHICWRQTHYYILLIGKFHNTFLPYVCILIAQPVLFSQHLTT